MCVTCKQSWIIIILVKCVGRFILGTIKAIVLVLPNVFIVNYGNAKWVREISKRKCNVSLSNDYWIDLRSEWNVSLIF